MVERTTSKSCKDYHRYGGAGIGVDPRWLVFENFFKDMGLKPEGYTLERKKNSKGYGPSNCKWATPAEQARNRKSNAVYSYGGKTQVLTDWAKDLGISTTSMKKRIAKWPADRAFTEKS